MPDVEYPVAKIPTAERKSRRYLRLGHYILTPYASEEQHYIRIIVIDPAIGGPTWLVSRGQTATRKNTLALSLPNIQRLTPDLAVACTGVCATHFGLWEWHATDRRRGKLPDLFRAKRLVLETDSWNLHLAPTDARSPSGRSSRRPLGAGSTNGETAQSAASPLLQ